MVCQDNQNDEDFHKSVSEKNMVNNKNIFRTCLKVPASSLSSSWSQLSWVSSVVAFRFAIFVWKKEQQ